MLLAYLYRQMKYIYFTVLMCLLATRTYSQKTTTVPANSYAHVDKIALQLSRASVKSTQDVADYINTHFSTPADKVRAVFIWTASNIQYDIVNMYSFNFYETKQQKIDNALKSGQGVCINYAAIFNDVSNKCGIKTYTIEGYTKTTAVADYASHAWCAALIDTGWYLFDPTWGAGYVNNNKFVKKINNAYYMVAPAISIKSHMPFDPMWECLHYQVSNNEFCTGRIQPDASKSFFNYKDSIAVYERQSERDKLAATARRCEGNGVQNSLIFSWLESLKHNIAVTDNNEMVEGYNTGVANYNDATNLFNVFVNYYNNQFKPAKSDPEIRKMIDTVQTKIDMTTRNFEGVHNPSGSTLALMQSMQKNVSNLQQHLDDQKKFLDEYLQKGNLGRKLMFHKYTWMGMPLN